MDTNTGQILTPDQVKAELEKAMVLTGKQSDIAREIKAEKVRGGMLPSPGMTVDEAMAKFMPDHVPLKPLPDPKCRKCYGVGHKGKNLTTGKFVPCSCTQ